MRTEIMPRIWGGDQLLAFSGIDGPTNWADPFVLATGEAPGALNLKLPVALSFAFEDLGAVEWQVLLGDAVEGQTQNGAFAFAFADHHTLCGMKPKQISMSTASGVVGATPTPFWECNGTAILGWQKGSSWGIALRSPEDRRAVSTDLSVPELLEARKRFVCNVPVPEGLTPARVALLRKALSVMKVNVHSANGTIERRWSTPDRWPHRHMWLWDSAFHAVGMGYVDIELAQDELLAMLDQVHDSGMLPHMVEADGTHSGVTQPPILAWAAHRLMEQGADTNWLRECLPPLKSYLDWDRANRDRNHNAVPEWHIEGNPLCRCGESGLDNSTVYDRAVELDAPDFAAFLYNDYECLADIAEHLGEPDLAEQCHAAADPIAVAVNRLLWADDFYYHHDLQGRPVPVKAISGFMPLFAGIADTKRAAILAGHLRNKSTFGAPSRVPSESLDSGTFCKDMWRGPAWMNLSYLILLGLRRYGYCAAAEDLKGNMLDTVAFWYEREGCLFEYYDALGLTSPRLLDRKQRLISGKGIAPIADYHWTAAVTAALLLE